MLSEADRLEVWGDPIAHSLSPALHTAAYAALGRDWSYGRRRVDAASFAGEFAGLDRRWRGLSLTMPLKAAGFAAARARDRAATLSGAVNTLLLAPDGPRGFNTDVGGIVAELSGQGLADIGRARIVGAGATATSALLALAELGVRDVDVAARRPSAAAPLEALGAHLGVRVQVHGLDGPGAPVPLTFATLPGGAVLDDAAADALASGGGVLYDVVYGHWPTALAQAWERRGQRAVPGLGMLIGQALLQVRIFASGEPTEPLPDEAAVLTAMRTAVIDV